MASPIPLKIDFVSDVSCPWCAVGLGALEQALARLDGEVQAELHFRPFELNPQMPPGGQDITEHLTQKYGSTPAQQASIRENIHQRGAEVGFTFRPEGRGRIYNTFDAHRLLHWAALQPGGHQPALKKALLKAYFTDGQSPESHDVLTQAAVAVGLDGEAARHVLASSAHAEEVRTEAAAYRQAGINSVPAIIFNSTYLVSGGQPVEVFEQVLRKIVAETRISDATA